MALYARSA